MNGPPPPYSSARPAAAAAAPELNLHPGVLCDQCGAPVGSRVRYKCLLCPNFDLCAACHANPAPARWIATAAQRHTVAHILARIDDSLATVPCAITTNRSNIVHPNTRCSQCAMEPIVGRRFR